MLAAEAARSEERRGAHIDRAIAQTASHWLDLGSAVRIFSQGLAGGQDVAGALGFDGGGGPPRQLFRSWRCEVSTDLFGSILLNVSVWPDGRSNPAQPVWWKVDLHPSRLGTESCQKLRKLQYFARR
jgi:hypothetical protein